MGKVEKYPMLIIMSKLLERILTDRSARDEETGSVLVAAENEFLSWDGS